jgi:hypothetical protein
MGFFDADGEAGVAFLSGIGDTEADAISSAVEQVQAAKATKPEMLCSYATAAPGYAPPGKVKMTIVRHDLDPSGLH